MCAKGLDCGTMFLVKGTAADGKTEFTTERNCFLQASSFEDTEDVLKEQGWSFVKSGNDYFILGEHAIKLKNLLTVQGDANIVMTKVGELRRPMKDGILNTSEEKLSVAIIQKIISNLLGPPAFAGETLCFCAPGDPVDRNLSVIFHKTMLNSFLSSLGYSVECIPEGLAIIFSERPVATDTEGEQPYSGIAISCLPPGQKVITKKGFVDIEDIESGDIVMNKNGDWVSVLQPTNRRYSGDVVTIFAYGHGSIQVTGDHLVWAKQDGRWQWVQARNIKQGSYVCQPWLKNYDSSRRLYIHYSERVTCSDPYKVQKEVTSSMSELIGYFLGDGHTEQHVECVAWTFEENENDNIKRVKELAMEVFGKDCSETKHGEHAVRIKLYHKGFAGWLKRKCYDSDGRKIIPFDLQTMSDTTLMYMSRGLIMSDGYFDCDGFRFGSTSPSLSQMIFLFAQKIGLNPSLSVRQARQVSTEIEPGRYIAGKYEEISISCQGLHSQWFTQWLINPVKPAAKSFVDGFSIACINNITVGHYEGVVYDLVVDGHEHSFCVPGFVLHNCGAGMVNVCFSWKKIPLINFSIARSGDWIDQQAAQTSGCSVAAMTKFKETKLNLAQVDYSDMKQAALDIYYQTMIQHTVSNFVDKFKKLDSAIDAPLEIVVAGGTASVPGFIDKFKEVVQRMELPFKIKEVRMASSPLLAVANGCLAKAIAVESKAKKAEDQKAEEVLNSTGRDDAQNEDTGGESRKIRIPKRG